MKQPPVKPVRPESLTAEDISGRLERLRHLPSPDSYPEGFFSSPPKPAAVLIPLLRDLDEWRVLYIRRSRNRQDHHSGQVAFPGGRQEPGDSDIVSAALREAKEEIGLNAPDIQVLGRLNQYHTISNFIVTPVVAEIRWPIELKPDPREVSRVFTIPLGWLADRRHFEVRPRPLPDYEREHDLKVVHYQEYEGERLWGITARLTLSLVQLLDLHSPKNWPEF